MEAVKKNVLIISHKTRIMTLEEKEPAHDKLMANLQTELFKVHHQVLRSNLKINCGEMYSRVSSFPRSKETT